MELKISDYDSGSKLINVAEFRDTMYDLRSATAMPANSSSQKKLAYKEGEEYVLTDFAKNSHCIPKLTHTRTESQAISSPLLNSFVIQPFSRCCSNTFTANGRSATSNHHWGGKEMWKRVKT